MKNALPYTRDEELNTVVYELMTEWDRFVKIAKSHGMDIRFAPNCTETLELYFHDDYPDMLLVDKEISCKTEPIHYVYKEPEPNYIFDPSYVVRPDGSLYLREVSIIPNPEKGET